MDHPAHAIFEAYVIGALTEPASDSFTSHVATCEVCAKKLEAEARAELGMLEIHAATKAAPPRVTADRPRIRRPRLWAGASVLAIAASVLLILALRRSHEIAPPSSMTVSVTRPSEPIPLVVCPDGVHQEECVETAHRHGLFVRYPAWGSAPPLGGSRGGQGPSGSPFPSQM